MRNSQESTALFDGGLCAWCEQPERSHSRLLLLWHRHMERRYWRAGGGRWT